MSPLDALLPEFDREFGLTRLLLDRIPDDAIDWRPHARSRSLGRLGAHLAAIPRRVGLIMQRDRFDLTALPDERDDANHVSRTSLVARFDAEVEKARASLHAAVDGAFDVPWTLTRRDAVVFTMPRLGMLRYFVFNHLVHHRGQLTIYLRMRDVPIPALYGPSADEGGV